MKTMRRKQRRTNVQEFRKEFRKEITRGRKEGRIGLDRKAGNN